MNPNNIVNRNRLGNVNNSFQNFDQFPRMLACCSAGVLRSPTTALVLSQDPFNFNTRACGINQEFALIPIDPVLVSWSDFIVVMDGFQEAMVRELIEEWNINYRDIYNFDIPDQFDYRDPELIDMIRNEGEIQLKDWIER